MGWNVSRGHIAKIESGEIWVSDIDHLLLSRVFCVDMEDLLPNMKSSESLFIVLSELTGGHLKMLMSPDEILESKSAKLLNGNKFCPEFGTNPHSENSNLKDDGL